MSSLFSIEHSDSGERTVLSPDSTTSAIASTPATVAYGLDLNDSATALAIAPSPSDIFQNQFTDDINGNSLNISDPLLASFYQNNDANVPQTASARTDELTGIGEGEELLLHLTNATASSSNISGDLSFSDSLNPTRLDAFKDDYLFSTQRDEIVQLNLDSSVFDTYLQLVDASTDELLVSDDDGGQGSNSQISFTAEAGRQYLIRATSYYSYAIGSYSLTSHIDAGDQPSPPSSFDSAYGYGLVDAASAVATAVGQSRFSNVTDIGGNQWNNDMINAPEVWSQGYTGEGVTVAVIDSGVDIFHEDLRNNIWQNTGEVSGDGIDNDGNGYIDDIYGWNFGDGQNNNDVRPGTDDIGQGHGTHVAGTIAAANNGLGMTGVAYNSNIMAIRMGDTETSATGGRFVNGGDLAEAIRYAVDNGVDVINMSLGWGDPTGSVRAALAYASERNVIAVMASGNESLLAPSSPANNAIDYGLSVGAVTRSGVIADFSNQAGSNSQMRHVMAPGEGIYSTLPNDTWNYQDGTSMAAPHVAGVVALMLSANPNLTHAQVREILTGTATANATNTTFIAQTVQNDRLEDNVWNRSVNLQPAIETASRWRSPATDSRENRFASLLDP
ncbi:MAG: S8 family peptidase [Phormidesmis sp.]